MDTRNTAWIAAGLMAMGLAVSAAHAQVATTLEQAELAGLSPEKRAEVQSRSGAVKLSLWGNLPELYDFPVLETAVVLNAGVVRVPAPSENTVASTVTFVARAGVTAVDGALAGPVPALLVAVTVKVYAVPLVSPVTTVVASGGVPVTTVVVWATAPMNGVTVYDVIAPNASCPIVSVTLPSVVPATAPVAASR